MPLPCNQVSKCCDAFWDSQCQSNCHPRDYQRSFFLSALPSHFRESKKTKHHQFSFYTRMQYTKPKDCCHVMGMSLLKVGENIISTIAERLLSTLYLTCKYCLHSSISLFDVFIPGLFNCFSLSVNIVSEIPKPSRPFQTSL